MIENIKWIAYWNKIQKKVRCESIRNVHALLKYCLFYLRNKDSFFDFWLDDLYSPGTWSNPIKVHFRQCILVLSQIHYEIYIFLYIQISRTSFDKANVHPANTSKEYVNMFVLVPMSFLSLVYVLIISWGPMKSVLGYFRVLSKVSRLNILIKIQNICVILDKWNFIIETLRRCWCNE